MEEMLVSECCKGLLEHLDGEHLHSEHLHGNAPLTLQAIMLTEGKDSEIDRQMTELTTQDSS